MLGQFGISTSPCTFAQSGNAHTALSVLNPLSNPWIIDSRASDHMTSETFLL